jgi:hypothetical protein
VTTTWAQRCSCGGQGITHLHAEHHEPIGPADVDPHAGRGCGLCGDHVTGPCPECGPTAIAALARVRAELDRIEAAVRANPQHPDFDGAYLACIRHIRTAVNPPTGQGTP